MTQTLPLETWTDESWEQQARRLALALKALRPADARTTPKAQRDAYRRARLELARHMEAVE